MSLAGSIEGLGARWWKNQKLPASLAFLYKGLLIKSRLTSANNWIKFHKII